MIDAIKLAKFAEENGWIVVDKDDNYTRYLTSSGQRVLVEFYPDGSMSRVYP